MIVSDKTFQNSDKEDTISVIESFFSSCDNAYTYVSIFELSKKLTSILLKKLLVEYENLSNGELIANLTLIKIKFLENLSLETFLLEDFSNVKSDVVKSEVIFILDAHIEFTKNFLQSKNIKIV
jgi:hypothetical protein